MTKDPRKPNPLVSLIIAVVILGMGFVLYSAFARSPETPSASPTATASTTTKPKEPKATTPTARDCASYSDELGRLEDQLNGIDVDDPESADKVADVDEKLDDITKRATDAGCMDASSTTVPTPDPAEKKLTSGQENAIGAAEDYLDYSAFSKSGLAKQLEFEGYSAADAKFAVGHIDVDWNEQAAKSAKDYLSYSHFSRAGLIKQLEFEGFTSAQAKHGANTAGL